MLPVTQTEKGQIYEYASLEGKVLVCLEQLGKFSLVWQPLASAASIGINYGYRHHFRIPISEGQAVPFEISDGQGIFLHDSNRGYKVARALTPNAAIEQSRVYITRTKNGVSLTTSGSRLLGSDAYGRLSMHLPGLENLLDAHGNAECFVANGILQTDDSVLEVTGEDDSSAHAVGADANGALYASTDREADSRKFNLATTQILGGTYAIGLKDFNSISP
jgi:hypothetical protein